MPKWNMLYEYLSLDRWILGFDRKKIGRMLEGEALASSVLPQWMADELKQEGLLGVTANGSRKVYRIIDADLIWQSK